MVVVRLERRGTKKTPHHRIVVTERNRAQGGRVLETLGYYDPSATPVKFSLDETRLVFWRSSGAQVSEAVALLIKKFRSTPVGAAKPAGKP
ncbi:MAG: 30S ribosomal protein S16 [Rhodospirillales bacterium RIFCSPLOWO2_01_FULL_65_14]|nr:MAG: 30S ribosomal protein S16 [Rhodospirillales bacterium RIFCSPLOWO2_01_FULL_65_14]